MSEAEIARIDLLGGLRVHVGGRTLDDSAWRLRKARSLLKLLALAPRHRMNREQAMDALWPDLDPSAAANQLRKALHVVRRGLPVDPEAAAALIRFDDAILSLGTGVEVDVDRFRALGTEARRTRDAALYRQALELYRGELLPDDLYDEWASSHRERLRAEFGGLAMELAELLEARAELDEAVAVLGRVLDADPVDEDAHRALMRIHALAGRRHDALRQFEELREALRRDLDVDPDVATMDLYERIRAGQTLEVEVRTGLWEEVGDLRHLSGDAVGAAAAYAAALGERGTGLAPLDEVRLRRKLAYAHLVVHDLAPAAAELDAAESMSAAHDDPAEVGRLRGVRATWLAEQGRVADAQDAAEESLRLAREHGVEADVAAAFETLAIVHHFGGRWQEGLQVEIERLGTSADTDPQLARVFEIHHCIGQYHLYGDELFEGVEDYARRTLDLATRSRARRAQAFAWCLLGESLLLRGRWDEAGGCLERAAEIHAELATGSGALPWQRLGELAACRENFDVAKAHVRRGMAIATVSPMARHVWGRLYATEALIALEEADPERAVQAVRSAAEAAVRYGNCPTCDAMLHPAAAEAFAALGDEASAASHAEAAERVAGMWASSAWRGMAITARAFHRVATGEVASARSGFQEAGALFERAGQPYWADRSRRRADTVILA